jgi:hypothetical protein
VVHKLLINPDCWGQLLGGPRIFPLTLPILWEPYDIKSEPRVFALQTILRLWSFFLVRCKLGKKMTTPWVSDPCLPVGKIGKYINVHCSPFAENYKNIFEAYGSLHCLCKEIYPLPIYPSDGYGPKPYCPNVHQRFGISGSHHQNFIAFDPHMFILDVPQSISKSLYLSNHSYHLVMTNSSENHHF